MAAFHLLVVAICLIGGTSGQQYFLDTGEEIVERSGNTVTNLLTQTAARHICYNGGNILYADATTVYQFNATSSSFSIVTTVPDGGAITSLACCCNLVAVSYNIGTGTDIAMVALDTEYITVEITTNIADNVLLECLIEDQIFIALTRSQVWTISFDTPTALQNAFFINNSVNALPPTLVDFTAFSRPNDGGFNIAIVSGVVSLYYFEWDGTQDASLVSASTGFFQPVVLNTLSITSDLTNAYILVQPTFGSTSYSVVSIDVATLLTGSTAGNVEIFSVNTNRVLSAGEVLAFCGTDCTDLVCDYSLCDCDATCGFCSHNTTGCQCESSLLSGCFYSQFESSCVACVGPPESCVLVYNPLAQRRIGPDIEIVGYSKTTSSITFSRYVDAGRYSAPNLPQNTLGTIVNAGGSSYRKIGFPVQSRGRGRRFGVFAVSFSQGNVIPAISTENSRFVNRLYSYVVSAGDPIDLVVDMRPPLDRFTGMVRWRFTPVNHDTGMAGSNVPASACQAGTDRRMCRLTNANRASNEGVYEAYRLRRGLRNWHPFILLYVRGCPADMYGVGCDMTCPPCLHGMCEETCGECVCYPGWMGADCSTACTTADEVGPGCSITCSDLFGSSTNCQGVLIFNRGRLPSACRSGLASPECMNNCPTGFFGPNCGSVCPGGTCNARNGL